MKAANNHGTPGARGWQGLRSARILAACLALVLVACGPGTGGTGTGDLSLSGTASDKLSGITGTWVHSAATNTGLAPCIGSGTATCAADRSDTVVRFEANAIHIASACWSFDFLGAWGLDAEGQVRVHGSYSRQGDPAGTSAASLTVIPLGPELQISLQDAFGVTLLERTTLARQAFETPPQPGACAASAAQGKGS